MKILYCMLFAASCGAPLHQARGAEEVVVEVHDPFGGVWVRNELIDLYLRLVNVGNQPIDISDGVFVFEQKNQDISHGDVGTWDAWVEFPRDDPAQISVKSLFSGVGRVELGPRSGMAFNEGDFDPLYIISWPLQDIRVKFKVDEQVLAVSEWVRRIEVSEPNLIGNKPLFSYSRTSNNMVLERHVYKAELPSGTWLFAASGPDLEGSSRICKIPPNRDVNSISFDEESGELTVFIDRENDAVKFDTGAGVAISGSIETVPHLHQWRSWAGQPLRCIQRRNSVISRVSQSETNALRDLLIEGAADTSSPVDFAGKPDGADEPGSGRFSIIFLISLALGLIILIWIFFRTLINQKAP